MTNVSRPIGTPITLTLTLAVALVLAGCPRAAKPDEAPKTPTSGGEMLRARDFYPLAVGNSWTYEDVSAAGSTTRTVTIVREEGGVFYDSQNGALRFDAIGLRDRDRYLLKEPLLPGATWHSVVSVQSTERYEIVEAGRPCEVPAGTFANCVRVRATIQRAGPGFDYVAEWTYAQGIGIVEFSTTTVRQGGPRRRQLEARLVSFHLE